LVPLAIRTGRLSAERLESGVPAGTDAWTLDAATGQYYLHQLLPSSPISIGRT
jgi:hypothetical protein